MFCRVTLEKVATARAYVAGPAPRTPEVPPPDRPATHNPPTHVPPTRDCTSMQAWMQLPAGAPAGCCIHPCRQGRGRDRGGTGRAAGAGRLGWG
ncbi:hypothetical protein CCO02nite_06540 [Cellulomonas composti]|uniref:Uncharacterized protein n=1 Tax=Cellulomonas composti TaxID=266130 RepID=A0A511J7L6_9CELL|nr:hypothetical protein CCO02nite_06540 [Cellulomonas composti]